MTKRFLMILTKGNNALNGLANISAVAAIFILMLLIIADVMMRYFFNSPLPGSYEIGRTLLVFSVFLALAYTQRKDSHIRVEVVMKLLPGKIQNIVEVSMQILAFLVFGALGYAGLESAIYSWNIHEYASGVVNMPIYPSRAAIPLGAALFCLQLLTNLINRFMKAHT